MDSSIDDLCRWFVNGVIRMAQMAAWNLWTENEEFSMKTDRLCGVSCVFREYIKYITFRSHRYELLKH